MAKSDKPLEDLDLSKAYSPPHTPQWAKAKDINGFDTETADGDIFMVSYAWDSDDRGQVAHADGEIMTPDRLFDLLTNRNARGALNMWYNLDFDANVFLKSILDERQISVLTVNGTVETDGFEITYIPSKFLRIKDSNKHVYTHYDASQFFYAPLADASEEWLNEEKLEETVDVTKFGKDGTEVNDYIHNNWWDIEDYARKDAILVRDLWKEAVDVGEDLDIPMGLPFSTGYLAESYLNDRLREKPGTGPWEMATQAWKSYAGGRFEVLKRGDIGPVAGPDINSAYPYVLSNLPDPKSLEWKIEEDPSIEVLREADFGFVTAEVSTDSNRPIQPFAVKLDDKLKYPALRNHEVTTLKEIFVNAYDYDYLEDFEISQAWLGYDRGGAFYPFDFITDLYNQRKTFESNGNMKKGMLLKIILNSMYGKMCQTTPKREEITEAHTLDPMEELVPEMSLPESIRDAYQGGFVEWLEAGAYFNPFLASYITGMTRLELHKRLLEYGLEDHTVMLATDSLMIERDAFERSDFANDLVKSGLGNWDYDYKGEAFVIGAGVYQVDLDNGKTKVKTRGFTEADLDGGLREAARGGGLSVRSTRPITAAEAAWQNQEISDIGAFKNFDRDIDPQMDEKRAWSDTATFPKLLKSVQDSEPLVLSG